MILTQDSRLMGRLHAPTRPMVHEPVVESPQTPIPAEEIDDIGEPQSDAKTWAFLRALCVPWVLAIAWAIRTVSRGAL